LGQAFTHPIPQQMLAFNAALSTKGLLALLNFR